MTSFINYTSEDDNVCLEVDKNDVIYLNLQPMETVNIRINDIKPFSSGINITIPNNIFFIVEPSMSLLKSGFIIQYPRVIRSSDDKILTFFLQKIKEVEEDFRWVRCIKLKIINNANTKIFLNKMVLNVIKKEKKYIEDNINSDFSIFD